MSADLLPLSSRSVDLWVVSMADVREESLGCIYNRLLSDEERVRQARFYFEKDRLAYLVTRAALRTVLSRYAPVEPTGWRFVANAYGKPSVADEPWASLISFNLAHTDGCVLLGVTQGRDLGVDVENVVSRNISLDIADRFFSPRESTAMRALAPDRQLNRFFELWTLKESYIKARGMGLSIPLNQFSFGLEEAHSVAVSFDPLLQDAPQRWHFWQFDIGPAHLAAACAQVGSRAPFMCARRLIPCVSEKPLYVGIRRNSANLSELAELITKRR